MELNRKKTRVGDPIPIRRDFDAIVDYEKLVKDQLLRDRAFGEAFSFGRLDLLLLFHLTTNFLATKPVDRITRTGKRGRRPGHCNYIFIDTGSRLSTVRSCVDQ